MSDAQDAPASPTLRIVRGDASPEDVAVLTALLAAAGDAETGPEVPALRNRWSDPARQHRRQLHPGPGAWRSSGW